MESFTFVDRSGSVICHRYVKDGRHFVETENRFPIHLYLKSERGEFKSLYGDSLIRKEFDRITAAREFVEKYEDVDGMEIYGNTDWVQQFIADRYPGKPGSLEFDIKAFTISSIDLEVAHDNGFPEPDQADQEIISISAKTFGGKSYAFGCFPKPATPEIKDVEYFECSDEVDLLETFIEFFSRSNPHIFTGWNVYGFDVPYLVNRINNVLGEQQADRLSPFYGMPGIKRTITSTYNKEGVNSYKILGVTVLDYQELYKKFHPDKRESYRLDYIGEIEEVGRKIDYSEYGNSLMRLFRGEWHVAAAEDPATLSTKDRWCRIRGILAAEARRRSLDPREAEKHAVAAPEPVEQAESYLDSIREWEDYDVANFFTEVDAYVKSLSYGHFLYYNTVDNDLVEWLDNKLQYVQLAVAIAMLTRSRLSDSMGTVKIWDNLIFHMALEDKMMIPPLVRRTDVEKAGGFVKETIPGLYRWPVTFDLTSLYPSIARLLNMSPETLISDPLGGQEMVDRVLSGEVNPEDYTAPGVCFAINGVTFSTTTPGIVARAMSFVFFERKRYKDLMKAEKNKLEAMKDELHKLEAQLTQMGS